MGLDIRPRRADGEIDYEGNHWARWTYSGFGRFRNLLAAEEGFDLGIMEGFGSDEQTPWTGITSPLVPLLNHSDCDGELSAAECAQILPRLTEVHAKWSAPGADQEKALRAEGLGRLIALVRHCAETGAVADFH